MSIHDIVIRGGLVVDGSGAPAREADVAIADGRIVAVGRHILRGRREIDARGKIVTPASSTCTPTTTRKPHGIRFSRRRRSTASPRR
jgi:hypothetical protein